MGRVRPPGGFGAPLDGRALGSRGMTALHPRDIAGVVSELSEELSAARNSLRVRPRSLGAAARIFGANAPGDLDAHE